MVVTQFLQAMPKQVGSAAYRGPGWVTVPTQVPTTLYVDSLGPDNLPLPLVSEMQMVTPASQNHSEDLSQPTEICQVPPTSPGMELAVPRATVVQLPSPACKPNFMQFMSVKGISLGPGRRLWSANGRGVTPVSVPPTRP